MQERLREDDMRLLAVMVMLALALGGCSVMRPALQAAVDRLEDPWAPGGARMYVYGENSIEVWTRGNTLVGIRELHDGVPYEWGDVGGEESTYREVDAWTPENWRRARWDAGALTSICVYGLDGDELCPPGE